VGKTTVARILAKALNCQQGPTPDPCGQCESCRRIATGDDLDVMEIDGASNRGIDQVRELRQNVRLAPAHSRFKVYYIDEVHMLTAEAFNALLKTLEEPPAHVKFIFSTTDAQRLPETVKSRCQRFDFRRISDADIARALEDVCRKEGLKVEDGVVALVARAARGSMRDALGTMDQLAALGQDIRRDDVLQVLGAVGQQVLTELVDALAREDVPAALAALELALFAGADVEELADQISQYLRDLLVASYCGADDPMLAGSAAGPETLKRQCGLFSPDQFVYMIQLLREAKLRARRDTTGRIALELAVIKMSRLSQLVELEEALDSVPGGPQGGQARPAAAGPAPSQAAAGALRRMSDKLRDSHQRPPAPPQQPAAAQGLPDAKYRQLLSCADDPETARQALAEDGLMKAFTEADKALGLDPVRLERRVSPPKEEEAEPEAEETPPADVE
jgi:DNA polymerase-3 subunit gamma/tau